MKRSRLTITEAKVLADLETARLRALEINAFAPAIRCSELQGKHIGMWKSAGDPAQPSLLDLLAQIPTLPDKKEED